KMLAEQAQAAGAEVRQNTTVKEILRLIDSDVAISIGTETISAKYILDCSGHGAVIGRHLKTHRPIPDRRLRKVAYFAHFDNVERLPGIDTGHPTIIMTKEGWFWLIGLNET